jgi:hypothetical protein
MRYRPASSREVLRSQKAPVGRTRRRHWWRWILGGAVALVVLGVGLTGAFVELASVPAPLALPRVAAAPSGPLDGTWQVASHSVAGFRVRETVIGFSNDVVGRTGDVTGTMTVTGDQVRQAAFQIPLGTIVVDGKTRQPQLVESLGVTAHPVAAITLAQPMSLPAGFSSGAAVTRIVAARLMLNGVTRPVTVTLSARRDGTAIDVAGSLPVDFFAFRITGPAGYGFLGSLADNGTAEFLMILRSR